jgi:hypothetical protein
VEQKVQYKTEGKPDPSALARLLLLWEEKRRALDEIEAAITDSVLQIRKTQTVGNVRASFYNPRKSYDYETPGKEAPTNVIFRNSKTVTNWRAVCEEADIDPIVTPGSGRGSVSIKLLD